MRSPHLERRALEALDEVCDVAPARRAAIIDQVCAGDPDLRDRVLQLLEYEMPDSSPFDETPGAGVEVLAQSLASTLPGTPRRVGHYRVIREIGRGGMGVVYEAEQASPQRRVAVKVVAPGLVSASTLARFRRETQVLAQLKHPGIAHIYESGTMRDDGAEWSYFAMELVTGLPLDQHADQAHLTLPQRMELIARVCDAVQHAHQKGIIHRDLKPSNVLVLEDSSHSGTSGPSNWAVDGIGQPKILDFGVAGFTDEEAHATLRTTTGQIVGTLAYMSPQQIGGAGEDLDTRTDVYALGVLLYKLVAGRLPHDLAGLPLVEAARVVREDDPRTLGSIDSSLRGDVQTIVQTAMDKDVDRRYLSAADLAQDLRRSLRDEPIAARPASSIYQLRKFARRHRTLVYGVAAVFLALVIGLIGTSWFAARADHAHRDAIRYSDRADRAAYRASLAAAAAAIREHDMMTAHGHLDSAPESLRGWAWEYLSAMLDESVSSIPITQGAESVDNAHRTFGLAHVFESRDGSAIHVVRGGHYKPIDCQTWDADTLQPIAGWSREGATVFGFSPDRGTVRLRTSDGIVRAYDVETGAIVGDSMFESPGWTFSMKAAPVEAARIAFAARDRIQAIEPNSTFWNTIISPDGRWIAQPIGYQVAITRPDDDETLFLLDHHLEGARDMAFDPTGNRLATVTTARRLAVFSLAASAEPDWVIEDAHEDAILTVDYSPDGTRLVTSGQDRTIRIWDAIDGTLIGELAGHQHPVLSVTFVEGGDRVLSADAETVRLWDLSVLDDIKRTTVEDFPVYALQVSPDGTRLVTAAGSLDLWDARSSRKLARLADKDCWGAVFGPGGASVYGAMNSLESDDSHWIVEFDVASGQELRRIEVSGFEDGSQAYRLTLSPDERFLAVEGFAAVLLDAKTLEIVDTPRLDGAIRFGPSGRTLTSIYEGHYVRVYQMESFELLHEFKLGFARSTAVFYLDEGATIGVPTADFTIELFDVATGENLGELRGHTEGVQSIAVLPDGSRIITGSEDRTIRLWDPVTFEPVAELRGHADTVWSLDVSPDGRTIFSGSGDQTWRRWDSDPVSQLLGARSTRHARNGPE